MYFDINVLMTSLILSTLQIKLLNAESREGGEHDAMGAVRAMWPCKLKELQLNRKISKPKQPHLGKNTKCTSLNYRDMMPASFPFHGICCSSSSPPPFLSTLHS